MSLRESLKLNLIEFLEFLKKRDSSGFLVRNLEIQIRQRRFKKSCKVTYARIGSVLHEPTLESLKLNLIQSKVSEVIPKAIPGYWQLNPTILNLNEGIYLCWRATNGVFSPVADKLGKMKLEKSTPKIRNQVLIGELDSSFKLLNQRKIHESMGAPSFEDPRGFDSKDSSFVVGTVITEEPNQGIGKWSSSVGVLNIQTGEIRTIGNPNGKQIEKNWVPITCGESSIKLLYSTSPHIEVEIDFFSSEAKFSSKKMKLNVPNISGGSQFVRLPSGELLRVGRQRFPVEGKGLIHFSYLLLYDENLQLIKISRPFIFQKIGFEICNGLLLARDGSLYFSWGEDDRKLYVMKVELSEVLSWLNKNEDRIVKFTQNRITYRATRKLLMS